MPARAIGPGISCKSNAPGTRLTIDLYAFTGPRIDRSEVLSAWTMQTFPARARTAQTVMFSQKAGSTGNGQRQQKPAHGIASNPCVRPITNSGVARSLASSFWNTFDSGFATMRTAIQIQKLIQTSMPSIEYLPGEMPHRVQSGGRSRRRQAIRCANAQRMPRHDVGAARPFLPPLVRGGAPRPRANNTVRYPGRAKGLLSRRCASKDSKPLRWAAERGDSPP